MATPPLVPGEVLPGEGPVTVNAHKPTIELVVRNTGDRPIQVGSHYHLAEVNPALEFRRSGSRGDTEFRRSGSRGDTEFRRSGSRGDGDDPPLDRAGARGYRLDVPAGTSRRFEPGIEVVVTAVPIGGRRVVWGLRGETGGPIDGD